MDWCILVVESTSTLPFMILRKTILIDNDQPDFEKRMVSARLAIRRQKSVPQLSKEVGISIAYWYKIEKGEVMNAIPLDMAQRIQKSLEADLGVPIEEEINDFGCILEAA
jgi:DNA-binding Xre family transcriptional regulator